jgi:hypothetical protein
MGRMEEIDDYSVGIKRRDYWITMFMKKKMETKGGDTELRKYQY